MRIGEVILVVRPDRAEHQDRGFDRKVGPLLLTGGRVVLHEHVAQRGQALRTFGQERLRPAAVAGAHLDQGEGIGAPELVPPGVDGLHLPAHQNRRGGQHWARVPAPAGVGQRAQAASQLQHFVGRLTGRLPCGFHRGAP